MKIDDVVHSRLTNLYIDNKNIAYHISNIITPRANEVVDTFYRNLLDIPETKVFLENTIVSKNLKKSMKAWLCCIFKCNNQQEITKLIDYQKKIGQVHANINIKFNYFQHGISVIKKEVYQCINESIHDKKEFAEAIFWVGELLDIISFLVSESYFHNELVHESNELSLKVKGFTQHTAIECERLRGTLLDWLRSTLTLLYQSKDIAVNHLPKLQYSNFGLWVTYKAEFLSPNLDISKDLEHCIDTIDEALFIAAKHRLEKNDAMFFDAVQALNDSVTKCSWFISSIVDRVLELDSGMDPLTRVFSRRYLSTILRKQTDISLRNRWGYAVLLVDLDHFKKINDSYGHKAGDSVLKQFAEILLLSVRASDFVFRYGGEEFLVVLGNVEEKKVYKIAEEIRHKVEEKVFVLPENMTVRLTCSIGVAIHTGHPDYNRMIVTADNALYSAKHSGRNKVIVA